MKAWHFILLFIISRIVYHCFTFGQPVADWLYFGGNGILQIGFFVFMLPVRAYRGLICAGLFYSIANLIIECLLLAGVQDTKYYIYTWILMLSLVFGYVYGTISKNR